ncbi:MAG: hypothetical protein Ct9H300mP1_26540 [Planctomycetaceae bacterium]|nr:MAG: hypothetical protein Ct9H300mP1_26540 [Planctomycetaceae bacterium]
MTVRLMSSYFGVTMFTVPPIPRTLPKAERSEETEDQLGLEIVGKGRVDHPVVIEIGSKNHSKIGWLRLRSLFGD